LVPNFDAISVEGASRESLKSGLPPRIMIDASHANSGKNPDNQPNVITDVAKQVAGDDRRIIGAMLESNIVGGRQDLIPGRKLTYGQSVTDGCIDWATTVDVLHVLARSVRSRRDRGIV
jgi:3-deoxy-7-phosphoheptulonate synthase